MICIDPKRANSMLGTAFSPNDLKTPSRTTVQNIIISNNIYLSRCYTIAWDRLSNQFFCLCICVYMYVCMYVYMYVSVGTLTVAFLTDLHEIW